MKPIVILMCIGCLSAAVLAQPVLPTADAQRPQTVIPDDFIGLSFETSNLLPDNGRYIFSAENTSLIDFFRALGVKSLRMGGGTVDMPRYSVPGPEDIDQLFAFAKAADVDVVYSLRMPDADIEGNVAIAEYIMQHYEDRLTCFAIGNEPDFYRHVYTVYKEYERYRTDWGRQAQAIIAAVPGAKFCGPNTGGRHETRSHRWTTDFLDDLSDKVNIDLVTQHFYGAGAAEILDAADGRRRMLSPDWLDEYQALYDAVAAPVLSQGYRLRLQEANNISGGVENASNSFAGALWVLDFMHWWAAHGASGVNIHNRRWIPNDVLYPKHGFTFTINPIGYGLKAFDLGGHGTVVPLTISLPDGMNMTAYAVRGAESLFVTIINKTSAYDAREASVTISVDAPSRDVSVMYLTAPNNDDAARTGITLGGSPINDDGTWQGQWTPLEANEVPLMVAIPPTSAAIIRIVLAPNETGKEDDS